MESKEISQAVISRLPRYFRYLGELKDEGIERVSSQELSDIMKVTASQIRQDFNNFGGFGQQGYGYKVEYLYEEIGKILGLGKEHHLIIIGAGNLGLLASGYLEQKGKRAAAYIDNAAWKWDSLFYGLPVLSPEVGVCQYPDAAYIIANAAHGQEMKEQLNSLGIRDDKVVICDNYDLFIAHILVPYWKKGGSND